MKQIEQRIKEIFDEALPAPSRQQTEATCERVLYRLKSATAGSVMTVQPAAMDSASRWWQAAPIRVAAVVAVPLLLVLFSIPFIRTSVSPGNVYAVVEAVDGSLYRLTDGKATTVSAGERIDRGEILRTNGGAGAVLVLPDGSRVEIRSNSELALETADDGLLVRLNAGGVIVTAAKQRTGHLYVQTRDVTVAVVGTVFFVNAEAEGSRVGVI